MVMNSHEHDVVLEGRVCDKTFGNADSALYIQGDLFGIRIEQSKIISRLGPVGRALRHSFAGETLQSSMQIVAFGAATLVSASPIAVPSSPSVLP